MTEQLAVSVKEHPRFKELVRKRNRFATILSIIMLVLYYSYIAIIAFDKELFGTPIGSGVITIGIPAGFGLIVITVFMTWLFVQKANKEYDALNAKLLEELKK